MNIAAMASGSTAGNFKISNVPLPSSDMPRDTELDEVAPLPSHYGNPLFLAMARNPWTLLVCWSVDWPTVFGDEAPVGRRAHVKLKSHDSERIVAVEPLSWHCSISDLIPAETYDIELGYYAPANQWNLITSERVTMPLNGGVTNEMQIDVAAIPFHLSFQRIAELLGTEGDLALTLARLEQQAGQNLARNQQDEQLLRALELSDDDLKIATALRQALTKIKMRPRPRQPFTGSSFGGSSWS